MKVKKLVAVILIFSLLFLLGCGSKKEENEGAAEKTKTENKTATKATASSTDQPAQSNGNGGEESRIIVNGEPVPELMWEAKLESASYNTGKDKDAPETLKLAMRFVISKKIIMQMGKKYGVYPTDEEIKKSC